MKSTMPMPRTLTASNELATEHRIRSLCSKLISTNDPDEFHPAVQELKEALHQQISEVRDKVADLALALASESESKASLH